MHCTTPEAATQAATPDPVDALLQRVEGAIVMWTRLHGVCQRIAGLGERQASPATILADLACVAGRERGYDPHAADEVLRDAAAPLDALADIADLTGGTYGRQLWRILSDAVADGTPEALGLARAAARPYAERILRTADRPPVLVPVDMLSRERRAAGRKAREAVAA